MHRLEEAVIELDRAVADAPRQPGPWRRVVQARLSDVTAELTAERAVAADAWLTARAGQLHRERDRLLARLSLLGPMVFEGTDLDAVRVAVARLARDVAHHRQRVNDLVYDAAGRDVGGSD